MYDVQNEVEREDATGLSSTHNIRGNSEVRPAQTDGNTDMESGQAGIELAAVVQS